MVSVIGLGGTTLRGTLIVSLPFDVLRRFHPRGGDRRERPRRLAVRAREPGARSNQGAPLTRGVRVELSNAGALVASEFRFVRFGSAPLVHRFDTEGQSVLVGFESIAQADARLKTPVPGGPPFDAGELVMF